MKLWGVAVNGRYRGDVEANDQHCAILYALDKWKCHDESVEVKEVGSALPLLRANHPGEKMTDEQLLELARKYFPREVTAYMPTAGLRAVCDEYAKRYYMAKLRVLVAEREAYERHAPQAAPVAYMAFGTYEGKWVPLTEYTANSEAGVKGKVMDVAHKEGYRGTPDSRLAELGWVIRPVFGLDDAPPSA